MWPANVLGVRRHQIAAAVLIASGVAVCASKAPMLHAMLVPIVTSVILLAILVRSFRSEGVDREREQWLLRVVMFVFAARLLVSLVIANTRSLYETLGPDAISYHYGAVAIVQGWDAGIPITGSPVAVGKEGFFYLLAGLYYVFGTYQVAGLVVNAALSAALVPIVHDTTRRLFGRDAAKVAAVVVAVMPSFFIWTAQLLREAPVLFLLALAANAATRLTLRTTVGAYLVLVSSLTLLFTLRANVAYIVAAGFIVGLAFGRKRLVAGVAAGAATGTFVLALLIAGGIGYAGFQAATGADLQQVSEARKDLAGTADSGYARDRDVSTSQKALTFLPIALPTFALGPFPWQVGNALQAGGLLDAASLWILLPSAARGLRRASKAGRSWYVLMAPALLLAASLSLLIGNFGTIVRERLQVTVLLIPIIAYGWSLRRSRLRPSTLLGHEAASRGARMNRRQELGGRAPATSVHYDR
jgi:4-amino-4-deoxy-L-arabinose transferase-like glycosyltransferase